MNKFKEEVGRRKREDLASPCVSRCGLSWLNRRRQSKKLSRQLRQRQDRDVIIYDVKRSKHQAKSALGMDEMIYD